VAVTTVRSRARLELLQYAPLAPSALPVDVAPTACGAVPAPPPTDLAGAAISLAAPVLLAFPSGMVTGEPLFVRLSDMDRNQDAGLIETVTIDLAIAASGDSEQLTLVETAPDSGVFTGHTQLLGVPAASDCAASVEVGATILASYVDPGDPLDTASAQVAVGERPEFVTKQASRNTVAVGDLLQYALGVENPASAAPLGIEVIDRLPPGFRYRHGSARVDDAPAPDPSLSQDGRTLSFLLPPAAAPTRNSVHYTVEVTAATPLGRAINRASARSLGGGTSFVATAAVEVRDDLMSDRSFLVGQIVVGSCDADVTNDHQGLEGVRVYLEDGSYAVSDHRGLYHFEGVRPGVHVVQLDVESLPPMYELAQCEKNTRFAGRARSQFVDVQAGGLWRADFHVRLRSEGNGELSQLLQSELTGDRVLYELQVRAAEVPLRDLRGVVMLPPGARYVPGSARVAGHPGVEPTVHPGVLIFRLGDSGERLWFRDVQFEATLPAPPAEGEVVQTRSLVSFRSPTKPEGRLPVAISLANDVPESDIAFQAIATKGLRPGEDWPEQRVGEAAPLEPVYDAEWAETAEPGLEWLRPADGFRPQVPALRIAVKHDPRHRLELRLNGEPVSGLNFEGRVTDAARRVAVSHWRGVDIAAGDNLLEVIETDLEGAPIARITRTVHYPGPPVSVELVEPASRLVADGATRPVIAVRLLDRSGAPAREGVVGQYAVDAPYRIRREESEAEAATLAEPASEVPTYSLDHEGIARIELEPTTRSGQVVLRFRFDEDREVEVRAWLEPQQRDWILVGLAEGTLSNRQLSGDPEPLEALGLEEGLQVDRRVAMFAKGSVGDDWLVTLSYDSERNGKQREGTLHGIIDPDRYFPLYGDASTPAEEAATQQPIFARVERPGFYALFGDYDTGLGERELSRYERSLNGFKSGYRGERLSFTAFGTQTRQAFVKDELPGDGTSGLYRLSRRDVVENSEQVTIETRDRLHPERVLASRRLARHSDYSIDYFDGSLFFKEPVPSRDAGLHPVLIVVDYEAQHGHDKAIVGGGRGALHLWDDRLELGASGLYEGQQGNDGRLLGADLRLDVARDTQLRLELARSSRDTLAEHDIDGVAQLASLEHRSERLETRAYFRQLRSGFGLGQQRGSDAATRRYGIESSFELKDELRLRTDAFRQEALDTGSLRDVLEGRAEFAERQASAYAGYRLVREQRADAASDRSQQLLAGGAVGVWNDRLRLRLDSELALSSDAADFPTRLLGGADYRLLPDVSLFAEQEFAFSSERSTADSRVGVKATPWQGAQATSSIGQQLHENGERLFANLGLNQSWRLGPAWGVSASLQRSMTLRSEQEAFDSDVPPVSGAILDDFTAVSLGSSFERNGRAWSSRVEFRDGELEDKWALYSGFYQELQQGLGYSLSLQLQDARSQTAGKTRDAQLRLGLAHRPLGTRWIVLDRLDLKLEDQDGEGFDFQSRRVVNNLSLNFAWDRHTQVSFQYASKLVLDTIDRERERGFTDLVGFELRHDLGQRFDLGLRGGVRHSYASRLYESSYGASLGYNLYTNLWVSVGYNFRGFRDRDFSAAAYSAQGVFFQFRYKFDQQTLKDLLQPGE
jgi:uncharacterized repeat protein (TIGR01451 family)